MNETIPVIIYGAGGHGKVTFQVLTAAGYQVSGFLDDRETLWGKKILGVKVLGGKELILKLPKQSAIIALGDNQIRKAIFQQFLDAGFTLITAIHPSAVVHETVKIGAGTLVLPGVVINVDSKIGVNCIINTLAGVDHDCRIANHTHIAPHCALGGGVTVGEQTLVGIGSTVLPGKNIGNFVVAGAGAVVTRDVPDYATVVGVPAKIIKQVEEV